MAKYVIDEVTLKTLANNIRTMTGTTELLTPSEMVVGGIGTVEEINEQTNLIDQILEALASKVGSPSGNLITFTVGGIEHQAEVGMTWADWCDSEYNTVGSYIYNNNVIYKEESGFGGLVTERLYIFTDNTFSKFVLSTDIIIENHAYASAT